MGGRASMTALRRLGFVLLAAVVVAGWQVALLHPVEHVDERGGFVHAASDHSRSEDGSGPSGLLCDALAALTACASPAPAVPAALSSAEGALPLLDAGPLLPSPAPPFFAQAPPALL
jgi:hypothetical protein